MWRDDYSGSLQDLVCFCVSLPCSLQDQSRRTKLYLDSIIPFSCEMSMTACSFVCLFDCCSTFCFRIFLWVAPVKTKKYVSFQSQTGKLRVAPVITVFIYLAFLSVSQTPSDLSFWSNAGSIFYCLPTFPNVFWETLSNTSWKHRETVSTLYSFCYCVNKISLFFRIFSLNVLCISSLFHHGYIFGWLYSLERLRLFV